MTEKTIQNDDRLIRSAEVRHRLGLSRTTFHRLRHRGAIPEPIRIGACIAWPKSEIDDLISRIATNRVLSPLSSDLRGLEPSRRR